MGDTERCLYLGAPQQSPARFQYGHLTEASFTGSLNEGKTLCLSPHQIPPSECHILVQNLYFTQ